MHAIEQKQVEDLAVEGLDPEIIVAKLNWEKKTLPIVRRIVRRVAEHENEEYRRER